MDHPVEFEGLNLDVLADLLRHSYAEIRQKDGSMYSVQSKFSVRRAMYRHLTGPPYNVKYNIICDGAFIASNNVLNRQCSPLKAQCQFRKMYESGVWDTRLGRHSHTTCSMNCV